MKKFLAAILAILYLSTSIGATVHFHYCMGRLVAWSLQDKSDSICSNCGMEKDPKSNNKCCKDECKQIKIDNDQKLSGSQIELNEPITELVRTGANFSILIPFIPEQNFAKINGPPLSCTTSLNILNCIFRI